MERHSQHFELTVPRATNANFAVTHYRLTFSRHKLASEVFLGSHRNPCRGSFERSLMVDGSWWRHSGSIGSINRYPIVHYLSLVEPTRDELLQILCSRYEEITSPPLGSECILWNEFRFSISNQSTPNTFGKNILRSKWCKITFHLSKLYIDTYFVSVLYKVPAACSFQLSLASWLLWRARARYLLPANKLAWNSL